MLSLLVLGLAGAAAADDSDIAKAAPARGLRSSTASKWFAKPAFVIHHHSSDDITQCKPTSAAGTVCLAPLSMLHCTQVRPPPRSAPTARHSLSFASSSHTFVRSSAVVELNFVLETVSPIQALFFNFSSSFKPFAFLWTVQVPYIVRYAYYDGAAWCAAGFIRSTRSKVQGTAIFSHDGARPHSLPGKSPGTFQYAKI